MPAGAADSIARICHNAGARGHFFGRVQQGIFEMRRRADISTMWPMASSPVRGCCPLDCQDSCSWFAHVVDGVVERMEGARDHPITRGTLCAKVNDYEKRTYAADRLLRPLRRVGSKGDGRFEPIAWDAALDIIAERFQRIIREHGPASLLSLDYLGSMGVVQRRALRRIFNALGASRQSGAVCGQSMSVLAAEGTPIGFDPEELVHSELIILWGCNLLSTAHHTFAFMLEARRRNGARLVAIDPRRTITAARCDVHLAIRPGTDHILALAMGHVLLNEQLADLAFASQAAVDLDEYRREASAWSPARAAAVCGVSEQAIVDLAREFGRARPATIRGGVAPQQTVHGEQFVRSLSALAVLGGHWQHRGGGLFVAASPVMREAAAGGPSLGPVPRTLDMARLGANLTNDALAPPVHGLMVWCANPAVSQPDARRLRQGLAREDLFLVVAEHFLTDTARFADIVLPSTTQLEHFDVQGAWGHHYISVNLPAIAPLGEAKSHGEMMRLLAPRLGLHEPPFRESDEEIAASALPTGVTLDDLEGARVREELASAADVRARRLARPHSRVRRTRGVAGRPPVADAQGPPVPELDVREHGASTEGGGAADAVYASRRCVGPGARAGPRSAGPQRTGQCRGDGASDRRHPAGDCRDAGQMVGRRGRQRTHPLRSVPGRSTRLQRDLRRSAPLTSGAPEGTHAVPAAAPYGAAPGRVAWSRCRHFLIAFLPPWRSSTGGSPPSTSW